MKKDLEAWRRSKGVQAKLETRSKSTSTPIRTPGPPDSKTDAQDAYDLGFGRSLYCWKDNLITFPMPPVPYQTKIGVVRNRQNKTDFQRVFGAAPP